jgi:CDP-diacylglycerol--glycerol-3-phosphate 3-phosphatidyltransferase
VSSPDEHLRNDTLTARLREFTLPLVDGTAHGLMRLGITPDALTWAGLALAILAAYFAAQGAWIRAGVAYLVGGPLDALDGALARAIDRPSRFGAVLDSTLDRYGEGALLSGIGYYFARQGRPTEVLLVCVALLGSLMVSYLRARSESVGIENKVGLLTRLERYVIMLAGLFAARPDLALWPLAVLSHFTVIQRLWCVYKVAHNDRERR